MNNKLISLLALTFIGLLSITHSSHAANDKPLNINRLMVEAADSLSYIIPYAYDDEGFRAPSNQAVITSHLKKLDELFSQKASLLGASSDTAWITLRVLQDHLNETRGLYKAGYYAMSQYLLTSTPAVCSTCHIQDSAHSSMQSKLTRESFANDYSYGEYLFTIRNYDTAITYYQKHLNTSTAKESRFRYIKPLERLLTIELGIKQSLKNAKELLQKHHSATNQIEIKQVISAWITGIDSIKSAGGKNTDHLSDLFQQWFSLNPNTSHEFILNEASRPQAIWLRAKLFGSLSSLKKDNDIARTLYMLAIIDRILGQDEPYSFANLLLKQCVIKYPKTDSAKHCLEEYKNHLSFYYGGSAGEAVPEELVKEYLEMKAIIDSVH